MAVSTAATLLGAPAASAARVVRRAVSAACAAAVIGGLSLQAFGVAHGVENRWLGAGVPAVPATSVAVDRVVSEQEDAGLRCRTAPALTDVVVVQYGPTAEPERGAAGVLGLADAVAVQRAGTGSIQRFCR
jgi:hypothetical protein